MKKALYLFALLLTSGSAALAQDLVPSAVSFVYDFQTAVITNLQVEVENLDNFSVTDDYNIQVYVDGIGTISCLGVDYFADWFNEGSVPSNGTKTYSLPNVDLDDLDNSCGLPTGNYHLRVVLDPYNDVDEDNENNNEQAFTSQDFFFESLVSIDPADQLADIQVYPNPAQDKFYIKRGAFYGDLQVEILAIDGRTVDTRTMEANQILQEVQVSDYESGIYFVRLQGDGQYRTQKIMVH